MSNSTRTRRLRGNRTRRLQTVSRRHMHGYGSRRRDAAYEAGVDYVFGLVALRSR